MDGKAGRLVISSLGLKVSAFWRAFATLISIYLCLKCAIGWLGLAISLIYVSPFANWGLLVYCGSIPSERYFHVCIWITKGRRVAERDGEDVYL